METLKIHTKDKEQLETVKTILKASKYDLFGFWSRRINKEHRIIYRINAERDIEIYSLKGRY